MRARRKDRERERGGEEGRVGREGQGRGGEGGRERVSRETKIQRDNGDARTFSSLDAKLNQTRSKANQRKLIRVSDYLCDM